MSRRPQLARRLGRLSGDLVAVAALNVVTVLVLLSSTLRATPVRVVLGIPFLVVLPGYALIAALFPEKRLAPAIDRSGDDEMSEPGIFLHHELNWFERLGLSVGTSIIVIAVVGLSLDRSPWELNTTSVSVVIGAVTLGFTLIAVRRRQQLPESERFSNHFGGHVDTAKAELLHPDTKVDLALNVLVIISLLLATGGTAYALVTESGGDGYTEFYLLSENDGELVAGSYPSTVAELRQSPVVVGIDNHHAQAINYTVVVELHRFTEADNSTQIVEEREIARYGIRVAPDETWQTRYVLREPTSGNQLRLVFLLFRGNAPRNPDMQSAEHEIYLWLNGTGTTQSNSVNVSDVTREPARTVEVVNIGGVERTER